MPHSYLKKSEAGAASSPSKARFDISISRPNYCHGKRLNWNLTSMLDITTSHAQCKWRTEARWREPIVTFHEFCDTARYGEPFIVHVAVARLRCRCPPFCCGMPLTFVRSCVDSIRHMKDLTPRKNRKTGRHVASSSCSLNRLVTRTPRLGNDLGHLVNLPLRTAKGTELWVVSEC